MGWNLSPLLSPSKLRPAFWRQNRTLFSHANQFQFLRGGNNLAQVFKHFHSLTVALEGYGAEKSKNNHSSSPASSWAVELAPQSQLPALPTGSESNSFVCKSHCHLKNKPTNQRTSVRKQIQVPVADRASKEDWTLARLTLAELWCEAVI